MTEHPQQDLLRAMVQGVWRRRQRLNLSSGLLAFCRWGIGLFLIVIAVDSLFHLPAIGRALLLAAWIGVIFSKAWKQGWGQCRRFNAVHMALQVEAHLGDLNSLLVTAIQFSDSSTSSTRLQPSTAALRVHANDHDGPGIATTKPRQSPAEQQVAEE